MPTSWSIKLARALFLTLAVLLGAAIAAGFKAELWAGTLLGLLAGGFFVLVDTLLAKFSFREFSFVTFGLLVGLFCAWLVTKIGIFDLPWFQTVEDFESIRVVLDISTYLVFGFLGITLALRSDRDQFSFIIPYVRFRRDASEGEPMLLDSNVIIDGRIPKVFSTGFLTGNFIITRDVIDELQRLADSHDPIKAARGQRGLDCVQQMQETKGMDLTIYHEAGPSGEPVDTRLATLAHELGARLLTNDVNLGKVARLRHVTVLNFNDLARALEPEIQLGDEFEISLEKPGKDKHQAVGYLPNGAMIVVNHAAQYLGESVPIVVCGTTQTSAGRLIFAELRPAAL
ncbi:MAG: PIN/TRAM domain-containing protein [Roseimicrobium sp.]